MEGIRFLKEKAGRLARRVLDYGGELFSWTGYARHGADDEELPLGSWRVLAASPRDDVDKNLDRLRARSRDLYMSSSFLSAILLARRDGVVGRGLHLDASIDADRLGITAVAAAEIEHKIETAFLRWSRNAGAEGESFDEIISLAYFSALLSGDCLVLVEISPSGAPRLSIVEGDLVRTPRERETDPRIRCGVEYSTRGRRVAYYCATAYEFNSDGFPVDFVRQPVFMAGFNDVASGAFLPPKSGALHVHTAFERPGQTRGIPVCSRVLGDMKQLDRYIKAELDASVVAAKPTVFIEHPALETESAVDVLDEYGETGGATPAPPGAAAGVPFADVSPSPIALGNGAILDLENGAKAQGFNPGRPNQAFSGFVDAMEAQIAAALGMPVEVATKKFSSSYSASRAVLLDADRSYAIDRALLIRQLVRPVYNAWLDANAAALGLTGYYTDPEMRSAWRGAEWLGEKLPSIDPTKEVDAAIKRVDACLSTLARESQELTGTDINANIRQRGFEESMMRQQNLIKDQNGVPIPAGSPSSSEE